MIETKAQGRAGQTSYTNMYKAHPDHNLAILVQARVPRHALTLNDLTKQLYRGTLKGLALTILD